MVSIQFYIRLITTLVLLSSIVTSQRQNEGYEYPTPEVPFTLPPKSTTPSGYEYPTPKIKFTLPSRTTTPRTTTPQGYEYPVPQNPLQLPRRGRRRPLESHKVI
nr:uncharacterized protein LOC121130345 [Lepeophtheirus salmonis]